MAALLRRRTTSQALCQCHRAFSTSAPRAVSLQWDKNDSEALKDALPDYPYGPTRWYKQSAKGLYGGQRVQFGNNVSDKFKTKTRRRWNPNIVTKRLWSNALNRYVQIRVTTRVLRTIDKLGGLDEYLLGEKEMRIRELGESGWWLRWAIMQTPAIKQRFRDERAALGLPEDPEMLEAVEEGLEASSAEEGSEEIETEPVVLDDTFKIEHNPDLPPLKFRVEPRKHIMLTEKGWVRTRPSKERWVNMAKDRIASTDMFANWKSSRVQEVKHRLEQKQERAKIKARYDELTRQLSDLHQRRQEDLDKLKPPLEDRERHKFIKVLEMVQERRLITVLSRAKKNQLQRRIEEVMSLQESDIEAAKTRRQSLAKWVASVNKAHEEADSPIEADAESKGKAWTDTNLQEKITNSKARVGEDPHEEERETISKKYKEVLQPLRLELSQIGYNPTTTGPTDVILTEEEQGKILDKVKKALNKELTKRITVKYEDEKRQHDEGVKARRIARKAKKAAREGGEEEATEVAAA
ncbi:54S ribosomal protein L24, mitochondrial [Pseudocercospora fuligena]|uniref:Large ribosomal subunit protein bL28m n=1 Tax=Pseudocercospora fuligena TaxID=685502 RepID=A0A8H6RD75_9PEZI|nr:54S ribosomal protein L24, mitochondrial [Pseudocercospora fuligena]